MAKKYIKQEIKMDPVSCEGCKYMKALDRGLRFCQHPKVRMIGVIKDKKICIWKSNGQEEETAN